MSIQILETTIPDGSPTVLGLGPLAAAAHVTIFTDNTVWIASEAGIDPIEGTAGTALYGPSMPPLQLSLAAGDQLFFGCPPGNGAVNVSFLITS